jgi:hypothetical protein
MGVNNTNLLEDIRATKKNLTLSSEAINQAHTAFTNHYNTFLTLAEQLEAKFKELETREVAVEKREGDVKVREQQVDDREKKCVEKEQKVAADCREVLVKIDLWNETEKRMQRNAAELPSVIRIDVSGKKFTATKEHLLKHKGSLFEQMIVSDHSQFMTSTGEMFIARDPRYVRHVLNFILNDTLPPPSSVSKRAAIEKEFEFFKIPFKFPLPQFVLRPCICNNDLVGEGKFADVLAGWLPNAKFQLLYKATLNGFAAADFHKLCDNKGPTLTVIRSTNGYLFGGFTPLNWDSTTNTSKNHAEGFIFTLTNPHNIPPTKYPRNPQNTCAIYCDASYGPTFGGDICVATNSNQGSVSYTNFTGVHGYTDTTGKGQNTFAGAGIFTTNEIEVFSVL